MALTHNQASATWYPGYLYKKAITIDHTKVSGGANLTNYPMLISRTDVNLKTVGNGGSVQNSNGFDIIFTDSTETTKLDHEVETYTATTGAIDMWVRIPTLSYTVDTVIYMYYDNSSISTTQENATGVWDSNFKGVWHSDETSGTSLLDSTSNAKNGIKQTATRPNPTTGKIGGADDYQKTTSDYVNLNTAASSIGSGNISMSLWFKPRSTFTSGATAEQDIFALQDSPSTNDAMIYLDNVTGRLNFMQYSGSAKKFAPTTETSWTAGIWYSATATFSTTTGMKLFVNGAADGTNVNTLRGGTQSVEFDVGRAFDNLFFDGSVDELRISNTDRTAGWITTQYNNENSPSTFYSVGAAVLNNPPGPPTSLAQYKSDGTTSIATGGTANQTSVVITAAVSDPDSSDTDSLCVEMQPIGTAFTNTETSCGTGVAQGSTESNTMTVVDGTQYHWQVRTKDAPGSYSSWVQFNSGSAAFTVDTSGGWYGTYLYKKKITIDRTKVSGSANLTNYPMLISMTDANLKTTGNAGYVQNTNGFDIVFTDSAGTTKLDHEIETYTATTGAIDMWVRIPTLSYTVDTVIYMYYDNSSISTTQENATGVWDSNFKGVWHSEQTSGTALSDSTSGAKNGTKQTATRPNPATGKIGGAQDYASTTSDYVNANNSATSIASGSYTLSFWFKPRNNFISSTTGMSMFTLADSPSSNDIRIRLVNGTGKMDLYASKQTPYSAVSATTTETSWTGGTWYFATASFSSTNAMRLFRNGVADGTNVATTRGTGNAAEFDFGRGWDGFYFDGSMDEIRISNSERTPGWITTEYNNENSPSTFYSVGGPALNNPPNAPMSLNQYRTNAVAIGTNLWTNETSVVIKANVTDSDASDTETLCVEMQPIGTGFTGTETSCGGSAVTQGNIAQNTMTVAAPNQYHWQVRSKDVLGAYSSWVQFNSGSGAFTVDATNPSTPPTPLQYKSDTTTSLSTGTWNNSTTVVFKATVTDNAAPVAICVEKDLTSVAFSNVEDGCSATVTSGSIATATISGIGDNALYHWQARALDAAGNYSSWVSYGGNSDTLTAATDFGIDASPPATGTVYDGSSAGVQQNVGGVSLTQLSANWSAFSDVAGGSGTASYSYAIGTTSGATDTLTWTSNGASTTVTAGSLSLRTTQHYYVSVKATDTAGNVSAVVTSPGQVIAPTLSFAVSPGSITFNRLNPGNAYTNTQGVTLTTSTNAYAGYTAYAYETGPMTAGSTTIADYASPASSPSLWSGTGFGYTMAGTSASSAFSGSKYAHFGTINSPDTVASKSAQPISGDVVTATLKVAAPTNVPAKTYQTTLIFYCVATY